MPNLVSLPVTKARTAGCGSVPHLVCERKYTGVLAEEDCLSIPTAIDGANLVLLWFCSLTYKPRAVGCVGHLPTNVGVSSSNSHASSLREIPLPAPSMLWSAIQPGVAVLLLMEVYLVVEALPFLGILSKPSCDIQSQIVSAATLHSACCRRSGEIPSLVERPGSERQSAPILPWRGTRGMDRTLVVPHAWFSERKVLAILREGGRGCACVPGLGFGSCQQQVAASERDGGETVMRGEGIPKLDIEREEMEQSARSKDHQEPHYGADKHPGDCQSTGGDAVPQESIPAEDTGGPESPDTEVPTSTYHMGMGRRVIPLNKKSESSCAPIGECTKVVEPQRPQLCVRPQGPKRALGSFVVDSNLSPGKIVELCLLWCLIKYPRQQTIVNKLLCPGKTVAAWSSSCRQVCIDWVLMYRKRIGMPAKVIEIDESKLGKCKNRKGRKVHGQLVFGGVQRDDLTKFFLVPMEKRNTTLTKIIREWIAPGTTIISDCWYCYSNLDIRGYRHMRVDHRREFVCSEKSGMMKRGEMLRVHTQNIERSWCSVRYSIPCFGRRKKILGRLPGQVRLEKESSVRETTARLLIHAADMHQRNPHRGDGEGYPNFDRPAAGVFLLLETTGLFFLSFDVERPAANTDLGFCIPLNLHVGDKLQLCGALNTSMCINPAMLSR
ncbi:hypothetical protein PR048_018783 [Dryococelus australis]|uniref:ISXO2-like transposase domain-containing protein n=1 Tax=Dryococelus australis TaxID=614101 RepID=A0ABQ9H1N3_9NEOP|nr:hypothetical protein PR048_018783 [Dryococelus australis]